MARYTIEVFEKDSQRRAYGNFHSSARIRIEGHSITRPHDDWFKRTFKALVNDFEEDAPVSLWHHTLRRFDRLDDNTVFIATERFYDD